MTIDLTADLRDVKVFPSTEVEEIAQNVQCILATMKFTVPMDREFGVDAKLIDEPIAAAQAKLTAEIASAINKFEPRAKLKKVFFTGDAQQGILKPRVRIALVESKMRGYV